MEKLTLRDFENSLAVQDAPNLSGILRSFVDVLDRVRSDCNGSSDDAFRHPICRLYAEQVGFLTGAGCGNFDTYCEATEQVKAKIAELKMESVARVSV